MHPFLASAERQHEWLFATLRDLLAIESPSTNKAAVDACGVEIARRFDALGARVERVPQTNVGDHLRVRFGSADASPVMLLGHFDTVWDVGQLARMPIRAEDGRLHGPGVFDMKAGIAVSMLAMRILAEHGHSHLPVCMLWTTDEEIGSGTSRPLIERDARDSRAVLVLEPSLPGGAAKTSRKGCGDFEIVVRGVSAHAGIEPGKGANAVHELAQQITAIGALQDLERGISVNVTVVSGGNRTNVIPDEARAHVDVRVPTMADAARIERALQSLTPRLQGTRIEVAGAVGRPPLERGPGVISLFNTARTCAAELGQDLGEGGTGGGSDGNFTAALGVPTLDGLGPQGDGAHALHEHVVVNDLPWRAAFLASLIARVAEVQ